jgi:hypothetical protein
VRRGITYRILVGKPEGKQPLKHRCRWVENTKMDFTGIGLGGKDWIHLTQE